ncbi:unnamed protein product [Rhizoctonia solani]|uniref:Fungal lipase-type domain-containing protein n=1 Tax=Rhizoctonia solani TaxID=456999 RepID=A0A8H3CGL6_9AGAM|nr:unnamed protein product [Rhizoctonia solani]
MVSSIIFLATLLVGASTISASPALASRAGVTSMTPQEIDAYTIYAKFARAASCSPAKLNTWSCGTACTDLPGMDVKATGGGILLGVGWYVGYYPSLNTIVLSNRETGGFLSDLFDGASLLAPLNPQRFPGIPNNVQVHLGFQTNQAVSAEAKLAAVQSLLDKYEAQSPSITFTGLGDGGAIALIDALYHSTRVPTTTTIKVVTHGMPRVGDQAFADYVDNNLNDVSRITNMKDIVPITPGRNLGFLHSSGEKHIVAAGSWVACAGQDNTDALCIAGAVGDILAGEMSDHRGPYEGIMIDNVACDA